MWGLRTSWRRNTSLSCIRTQVFQGRNGRGRCCCYCRRWIDHFDFHVLFHLHFCQSGCSRACDSGAGLSRQCTGYSPSPGGRAPLSSALLRRQPSVEAPETPSSVLTAVSKGTLPTLVEWHMAGGSVEVLVTGSQRSLQHTRQEVQILLKPV